MKKKKILTSVIAAVMCGSLISEIPANAAAYYEFGENSLLANYTLVESGNVSVDSSYHAKVTYQYITDGYTNVFLGYLYHTNYTTLLLSAENYDTFETIYAAYAEALDFDYFYTETDGEETITVTMFDDAPIFEESSTDTIAYTDEETETTLLALCADLNDAGVLLNAYYSAARWTYVEGGFYQSFKFTNIPEGETEAMQEIVSAYDDDAVVTAAEIDGVYTYTIATIEDYIAYRDAGDALRAAYPDATGDPFDNYCIFTADTSALSTESIDLLAALSDSDDEETSAAIGDINLDGVVNMADVIRLNKYVGGTITLSTQELACADCYADGSIDGSDALALLQYMIATVDTLPVTAG